MAHEAGESDVTRLLQAWRDGDRAALDDLIPLVYRELHGIASRHLARERPGHTLQSTALVHEAFLRLLGQHSVDWQNRAHFFAIAASQMRRILVDHARRNSSGKRGGAARPSPIDEAFDIEAPTIGLERVDALALDQALQQLEAIDPTQGRVVELRYFGGLTIDEPATVLGLSAGSIKREWTTAKAWLFRALEQPANGRTAWATALGQSITTHARRPWTAIESRESRQTPRGNSICRSAWRHSPSPKFAQVAPTMVCGTTSSRSSFAKGSSRPTPSTTRPRMRSHGHTKVLP
jgi:RNA polymerase sigma factor (TIGR02999 family)